jgi:type II restriction/modification system DNA methylase subunit YeeA
MRIITPMEPARSVAIEPVEFVRKWAAASERERQTSQEHFIDLCRMLGEQTPNEADPAGEFFAFEKGARTLDGDGFADVWLRGHFAWEYKGKRKDLVAAYQQVQRYREALENPPLLVVCDLDRYEVHTNWNTETWIYRFRNADIASDDPVEVTTIAGAPAAGAPQVTALRVLRAIFENPDDLKPERTRDDITRDAAAKFGEISKSLRDWGVEDMRIARFITKTLFCMFATDVGLLPPATFSEVIRVHRDSGDVKGFRQNLSRLFRAMNTGGKFLMRDIPCFNGNLFRDYDVPENVGGQEIHVLSRLDDLNWADVEPSIFGTLFERILDPDQRGTLGAHYTSRDDIELIVEPVLMEPLRRAWRDARQEVAKIAEKASPKKGPTEAQRARIKAVLTVMHRRLYTIRVLDPACGSGNFLYVSLALLKSLEKEVIAEAASYGIQMKPRVHPRQLFGIEVNDYAHELASIVIWIGYLQWKRDNALPLDNEVPILEPLGQIRHMDAILTDGKKPAEPDWPDVDVIVGNPPFLGGKMLRKRLGDEYVDKMFAVWEDRVPREADICTYWFEKARAAIDEGRARRAGLLATQAIRGGKNRRVLERIKDTGDIFYAQSDRPWVLDGAAVRVSMVGFDDGTEPRRLLNEDKDGLPQHALLRAQLVETINPNLTSSEADITKARRLPENAGISFMGDTKVGPFDIPASLARKMLDAPNPDGRSNADVVRPWVNGLDITRRPRDMWIIDFPPGTTEHEAAKYEAPFEFVREKVRAERAGNARRSYAEKWWIHGEPRPDMRDALSGLNRYLGTPRVTKYRFFVWLDRAVLADAQLIVFARSDDYFFGVLHSRAHEVWARSTGTQLREAESGFRYTPTTCFETFPFPRANKEQQRAIWLAARELDDLRNGWLNPQGMVGARELAKRTLTNLYNQRPTWLDNAHRALDEAVFAAYGWPEPPSALPDSEIIARLLKLNFERDPV